MALIRKGARPRNGNHTLLKTSQQMQAVKTNEWHERMIVKSTLKRATRRQRSIIYPDEAYKAPNLARTAFPLFVIS